MKRLSILFFILIYSTVIMNGQDDSRIGKMWTRVEAHIKEGLPKSALKLVDEIKELAQKNNNQAQHIKAIVYRTGLVLNSEEFGLEQVIDDLNAEINRANEPSKRLLMSYAAELISNYYRQNLYTIQERTQLEEATSDIRTWSSNNYRAYIRDMYIKSVNEKTHAFKTKDYLALLSNKKHANLNLKPTIYDLLLSRALEYFKDSYMQEDQGLERFYLDDPVYFAPYDEFATLDLENLPEDNKRAQVVKLYIRALKKHLGDDSQALALYDTRRLHFVHSNYTRAYEADSLYIGALEKGMQVAKRREVKEIYLTSILDRYKRLGQYDKTISAIEEARKWCTSNMHIHMDNILLDIWKPYVYCTVKEVYPSKGERKVELTTKNVSHLSAELIEVDYDTWYATYDYKNKVKLLAKSKIVHSWQIDTDNPTYESKKSTFDLPQVPKGHYVLQLSDGDKATEISSFWISDIAYATSTQEGKSQIVVVDRSTGEPLEGARMRIYARDYYRRSVREKFIREYTTNRNGVIYCGQKGGEVFDIEYGDDRLDLSSTFSRYHESHHEYPYHMYQIMTDRAIYRPGQTLHVKLLSLRYDEGEIPSIEVSNKEDVLYLKDANGQIVEERLVTFNALGSAATTFEIPEGLLNGRFNLTTDKTGSHQSIRIESYKRPTMEVELEDVATQVKLDDELIVKGNAQYMSGVAVQGADVQYKVVRTAYYGWGCYGFYYMRPSEDLIAVGQVKSSDQGQFEIPFTALSDGKDGLFVFRVEVDVTEPNGETQSKTYSIKLSNRPYNLELTGAEYINVDHLSSLEVEAKNAQGLPVEVEAKVKVYPQSKGVPIAERKVIKSFPIVIQGKSKIDISDLPFGKYEIQVVAEVEGSKQAVSVEKLITVCSFEKGIFPESENVYLDKREIHGAIGKLLDVHFGSGNGRLHVLTKVVRGGEVLSEKWVVVDDKGAVSYTPTDKDRGGVTILWMYVKNNKKYQGSVPVHIPWTHKELDLKLVTSRDVTKPGNKESWKLQVSPWNGKIHNGEIVATMYDASLETFAKHYLRSSLYPIHTSNVYFRYYGFYTSNSFTIKEYTIDKKKVKWNLAEPILTQLFSGYYGGYSPPVMMRSNTTGGREVMYSTASMDYSEEKEMGDQSMPMKKAFGAESKSIESDEQEVRENLDELVFFYPQVPIKKDGTVDIDFTMNDALTKWRMLVFAHDSEYRIGTMAHELVTQKELMVMPNVTRFVREGDTIMVPVTIYNLTEKEMNTEVGLDITHPAGVDVSGVQTLSVPAQGSVLAYFKVAVPETLKEDIAYSVWASNAKHRDVQNGSLPVLSKDILVTETKVVSVAPNSSVTIDDSWMKEGSDIKADRIIVEFTSNPLWYVVKALPSLAPQERPRVSGTELVNAIYAHALAQHIAHSNPKIKEVVDAWQASGNVKGNLEANQEIHKIALGATPWVRQAKNESLQRKSLKTLFDKNASNYKQKTLLRKMKEEQNSDGGISWYPGGRSSIYTTQYIMEYLSKLQRLGIALPEDMTRFRNKALEYMKSELEYRFSRLKIDTSDLDLSKRKPDPLSIQYMYIASFIEDDFLTSSEAYDFYYKQMKEHWVSSSLLQQVMIATVLYRNDDVKYKKIVQSISEHSFYSKKLGRYWNTGNGYKWYDLPIETHASIMTLYKEVGETSELVEMSKWLVQNKESNQWGTDQGTAAACYAVLVDAQAKGIEDTTVPRILINGKNVDIQAIESGSGFVRLTYSRAQLDMNPIRDIEIVNTGKQEGYGAVYYDFYQDVRGIKSYENNPLQVRKTLYKEVSDESSTRLVPVEGDEVWEVGDRIVSRIELITDRAMDFVELKDMRPSGVEPEKSLSGYRWSSGLAYYENITDEASYFYIESLPKGTYVFQSENRIVHKGKYTSGIVSVECMYAPKYGAHGESEAIYVK